MDSQPGPIRSPGFAGTVVACGAVGLAAGIFGHGVKHPAAYALNSVLVYRCEIGFLVFFVLYVVVVLVYLASYRRTPTAMLIKGTGAHFPDVAPLEEAKRELDAARASLRELTQRLADDRAEMRERMQTLEREWSERGGHGQ
jgi:hypothetical protein